ncbi:luciferin sulfotransferase-like [Maniola hyperantus]|uniref:luciferin sulfotransferase-like n=1 Tax=Aphantopus hyperantus TaxID=2795564 RepID=UPI0037491C7A
MMDEKLIKDFPYEVKVMDSLEKLDTGGYLKDFVHIGSKKYLLPEVYLLEAANIYNFPLRSDDTFIVTFPKSGTTMTQELIWLLGNNLDYEKAASTTITIRFPYLEFPAITNKRTTMTQEQKNTMRESLMMFTMSEIESMASPRFIKSHLPLSLLPPSLLDKTKVVYVIRDPRDVAVSFYHHLKLMMKVPTDYEFKKYWECFISDISE